jgi:nucleoside-diphosphate-sugar epimerase
MSSLRVLVVGASQGTGALTVSAALARGHQVTAFSRSPERLTLEHASLTKLAGSFHDAVAVDAAVSGHDAVIITAAPSSLAGFKENPMFFSAGTALVVEAMKHHRVPRLVVLSSLGTGESRVLRSWFIRTLLLDGLLKLPTRDHGRQEALTRASELEWVIARPGRLTNGPARGCYVKRAEIAPVPGSISRADVADFLVTAAESDAWVGKAVQIGG